MVSWSLFIFRHLLFSETFNMEEFMLCIWSFFYLKSVFGCRKLLVISAISHNGFFSWMFCDMILRSDFIGCRFNLLESCFPRGFVFAFAGGLVWIPFFSGESHFFLEGLSLLLQGVWECSCLGSLWLHLRVLVHYWHPRFSSSHPPWDGHGRLERADVHRSSCVLGVPSPPASSLTAF